MVRRPPIPKRTVTPFPYTTLFRSLVVAEAGDVLTVSELGFGKRTPIAQFPRRGRGGQGAIGQALSDKTGRLIGAVTVDDSHEVMLIAEDANLIRFKTPDVRPMGRNTQGVRLMRPQDDSRLVSIGRFLTAYDDDLVVAAAAAECNGDEMTEV